MGILAKHGGAGVNVDVVRGYGGHGRGRFSLHLRVRIAFHT